MVDAGEAEEADREGCCCCWRGLRLRSLLVEKSGWQQRLGRRVEQWQGTCSCYDKGGRELMSIALCCLDRGSGTAEEEVAVKDRKGDEVAVTQRRKAISSGGYCLSQQRRKIALGQSTLIPC
ncbi:hypothetical protein BHM03_00063079 [Ensete ventricosum]|nr:hypothetical protein BHM03_00063079 [Ensete ventricosum]